MLLCSKIPDEWKQIENKRQVNVLLGAEGHVDSLHVRIV
jgi:hypothetical protein